MKLYDEITGLWRFVKTDAGPSKCMETIEKTLYRLGLSKMRLRFTFTFHEPANTKQARFPRLCPFTEPRPIGYYVIWRRGG